MPFGTEFTSHLRAQRVLRSLAIGASTVAIVAAFVVSPAMAQATTSQKTTSSSQSGVETVTVTAQFVSQNLQNTPLSITAVTGQDLEERGINDLSQLGTSVPSLTLTKAPAAFGNAVQTYIRGIGQYDTVFASEPGVGIYIDDIYYGTMSGTILDLMDISHVDILKGPQGVLGGKNDIGGAIEIHTQKPTDDNSGYLEATYGSFNEVNVKGAMNLTVIPGHLFMRVSATSRNQDGFLTAWDYACLNPATAGTLPVRTQQPNCHNGTQGGTDVSAARVAFRAVIFNGMEDNFTASVIRDNSELAPDVLFGADPGTGTVYFNRGGGVKSVSRDQFFGLNSDGNNIAAPSLDPVWNAVYNIPTFGIPWDQRFITKDIYGSTFGDYYDQAGQHYSQGEMMHQWSVTNQFDWDILSNVHFENITGYRYYNGAYSNDSDVSPMSLELTTTYPGNKEWQEEARFTGSLFDGALEWTAGAFYYYRVNVAKGPVVLDIFRDIGVPLVFEQNDKYDDQNKSVYLHGIYHIWDNLEVFGGFRYTEEKKTYFFNHLFGVPGYPGSSYFRDTVDTNCTFALFLPECPGNAALVPNIAKASRPDWRAGVDYHFTDDVMAYFQFSTGYRSGGFNSRPFDSLQLGGFGPEQLKSYEIGAKTEFFDHRLRFNAALYTSDYSRIITPLAQTDALGLPWTHYVNLGTATDRGIELEATAAPIDNLLIDASYSVTDLSSNAAPGAPTGWLNGCTPAAFAAGICPQVAPGTIRKGSNPILFPASQAHFDIMYTIPMEGYGTVTPRLDYNWQDTIYEDANNNKFTEIPARGLLDARVTWDAPEGGWQASLAVTNLTDKRYFYDMFDLAIFGEGTIEAQPGPPREWMLTVRKAF